MIQGTTFPVTFTLPFEYTEIKNACVVIEQKGKVVAVEYLKDFICNGNEITAVFLNTKTAQLSEGRADIQLIAVLNDQYHSVVATEERWFAVQRMLGKGVVLSEILR